MKYIKSVLDYNEHYPVGVLAQSRKWNWQLVGSPVPRPVGITSDTETVHESAFERAAQSAALGNDHDVYRSKTRKNWLDAMAARKFSRCAFEHEHTVKDSDPRPPDLTPYERKRKLGRCDRWLRRLNGQV
jgi:hypothetical protein